MHYTAVTADQTLLVTLEYGADLAAELEAAATEADLASAWVVGWGAVEDAELAYFDQDAFAMESVTFEEPLSMPFFTGTVGWAAGSTMRSSEDLGADDQRQGSSQMPSGSNGDSDEKTETGNVEGTEPGSPEDTDAGGLQARMTGALSRPSGQALAGRIERATVFGGQAIMRGFEDELTYKRDDATGMERLAP